MSETMSSERLEAFKNEVGGVKIGGANPAKWERVGAIVGMIALALGVVLAIVAYTSAQNAGDFETIYRQQVFGAVGIAVAVAGGLLWLRVSITRHLRWWMIRNIHEQREQTDRIIEALRQR